MRAGSPSSRPWSEKPIPGASGRNRRSSSLSSSSVDSHAATRSTPYSANRFQSTRCASSDGWNHRTSPVHAGEGFDVLQRLPVRSVVAAGDSGVERQQKAGERKFFHLSGAFGASFPCNIIHCVRHSKGRGRGRMKGTAGYCDAPGKRMLDRRSGIRDDRPVPNRFACAGCGTSEA